MHESATSGRTVWLAPMAVLLPSDLRQWDNATTPLTLTKEHFKEVGCAHNLSFTVKKTKFITLCSSEWSTFGVGWPPEGTSDLGTVRVPGAIFRPRTRHPDQLPYTVTREDLICDPPPWAKPFLPPQKQHPEVVLAVCEKPPRELLSGERQTETKRPATPPNPPRPTSFRPKF